jgi:hypothetical protein
MTDEKRRAFVAAHPRGFYWVRDEDRERPPRHGSQLADPFVAFFTGDEDALWSYPGDDPKQGCSGRPFDHPTVIMRVQEPAEGDEVRRLDALVMKMWASHVIDVAPGWPGVGLGGMTILSAYGRQMVCPGDPDDVVAVLTARGFEAGLKHEEESSWSVVLLGARKR